jgi:hypothetical protein
VFPVAQPHNGTNFFDFLCSILELFSSVLSGNTESYSSFQKSCCWKSYDNDSNLSDDESLSRRSSYISLQAFSRECCQFGYVEDHYRAYWRASVSKDNTAKASHLFSEKIAILFDGP